MGLALEWLNSAGCRSLAVDILTAPDDRKSGDEVWAHCPFHSEKTPGDAFSYNYKKDLAKCQSCGGTGDLIKIYCAVYSLPEKEGFLEFKKQYGKDAPYNPKAKRQKSVEKPANYFDRDHDRSPAPEKWMERAGSFVDHSSTRLINSDKALDELENRWGISVETVLNHGFGINDKDKYPPVTSWGLPYEEKKGQSGKEKKIWLPKGLVMPCIVDGHVKKVKIRRPDSEIAKGIPLRYVEVFGGENWRFHCYGAESSKLKAERKAAVVVVIEAERDAALVRQECAGVCDGSLVAIAGGGASKRPHDAETLGLIRGADVVLVALDTDGPGAANAVNFWVQEFGFTKYWPVPKKYGKDVGEAFKNGLDLQGWVMAGLPGWVKSKG